LGRRNIPYNDKNDLVFHRKKVLPKHANGMTFTAFDEQNNIIKQGTYYSVGGGFVVNDDVSSDDPFVEDTTELEFPFKTGETLLNLCRDNGLSISSLMLRNERAWRDESEIRQQLLTIWRTMEACVQRGCEREGILPGGLKVKRRAPTLYRALRDSENKTDELSVMDWVNLYALAVNEENAAGGRVVTAPTNGAAGIIPSVLYYFVQHHCKGKANDDAIIRFLLTASAIGILYKENASISGAEVGCQGEVGVACSMAAGALTEVLGGTIEQVENAAEIGMEHNLGLTCDPVGGLVQVPCIERNAMGAIKAINASRLALRGDGSHKVSLDKVIKTMRDTGADMKTKYKETARGGLAVNIIEC
ncbi:MAG: L-serine ammonia-lyase, partial [Kangiellaceae bacterium]|nr:L-serine ammonia-lyase [Kangiellaceae bacterium]